MLEILLGCVFVEHVDTSHYFVDCNLQHYQLHHSEMRHTVFGQGRAHGLGPCEKRRTKEGDHLSFLSFLALFRFATCISY